MVIKSTAFINNGQFPAKYTCLGENFSPPLKIVDVPANTQSFVLLFLDRDTEPKSFVHWFLYNIPADIRHIEENSVPKNAAEGKRSDKKTGYKGPCPKEFSDEHQCAFTLYALNTDLTLKGKPGSTEIIEAMTDHILATAELIVDVNGTQPVPVRI